MSGNGVKVISAVMVEMLHEKSVEMVTVTVTVTIKVKGSVKDRWEKLREGSGSGSGSGSRYRSWYSVSHTTDSVWARYPTQRPGNIR